MLQELVEAVKPDGTASSEAATIRGSMSGPDGSSGGRPISVVGGGKHKAAPVAGSIFNTQNTKLPVFRSTKVH